VTASGNVEAKVVSNMSKKMDELRQRGLQNEGFREGYEARDGLIRMGEMLRKAREASGLTQEALAAKIGMKQPAVSRLESGFGPHGPEVDTVMRFVHGCNLELVIGVQPKVTTTSHHRDAPALAAALKTHF
jgi:ribosome-binding protein aMBF1 (putative translation factor)